MRQVEMTLVKHPRNARRAPEYSVTHTEAVFLSFWKKQRPRDDVDLVGDASDAPAELFQSQPRAAIQQAILRAHVVQIKRRLDSVSGAAVIRRRREVASVIARMLVVRKARPQAGRHVCGLKVARVSAAWRVLGLGVEPLLRQSFDDPQRVPRPLVKMHYIILVVARPVAHRCAMLERRMRGRSCTAADPGSSGT